MFFVLLEIEILINSYGIIKYLSDLGMKWRILKRSVRTYGESDSGIEYRLGVDDLLLGRPDSASWEVGQVKFPDAV